MNESESSVVVTSQDPNDKTNLTSKDPEPKLTRTCSRRFESNDQVHVGSMKELKTVSLLDSLLIRLVR